MLWDLIRDFFVQHVFGGLDSTDNSYSLIIGDIGGGETTNEELFFQIGVGSNGSTPRYINICDWLSTTATIIVMCLVIYFFIRLTIYFFKQGAGLFKW